MSLARATRGRSVDRSRSTHATPRSKPLHSRSHHHQMQLPTTCPVIESKVCDHQCPCAACEDMHATYALRTMWRVSESCVHACLDTRRLTYDIERVQRAQSARRYSPSTNFSAAVLWSAARTLRRMLQQLCNARSFSLRIFDRHCTAVWSSAGCNSGTRGMRCRRTARGFARGLLFFSDKQTAEL